MKIKDTFKNIMSYSAMTAVLKSDEVLYKTEFDYSKYYKMFFNYMADEGYKEYTQTSFLREKIDEFGNKFIIEYEQSIITSDNDEFQKKKYLENLFEVKKKFVGNLFEMICIIYFTQCDLSKELYGYRLLNWDNGTENDMLGSDGSLTDDTGLLDIPINAKHSLNLTIDKDIPFHKLMSYHDRKMSELIKNKKWELVEKYDKLHGVIITDIDVGSSTLARKFKKEKFPDIYIINCVTLWEAMGCTDGGITKQNAWKTGKKWCM